MNFHVHLKEMYILLLLEFPLSVKQVKLIDSVAQVFCNQ